MKRPNVRISTIIVSYNTRALTLDAISSLIKFKPKVPQEIIIVDNGSTDGSIEVLRKVTNSHKNVLLIENARNLGFAKANNIGIKKASGEYVFLLNSDTRLVT